MVAIADVGASIAREALKQTRSPRCPHVFELYGPQWSTPLDVQAALSAALNKEVAVKPVERGDLGGFHARVFPAEVMGEWVEMATSFLLGGIMQPGEVEEWTTVETGKVELQDAMSAAVHALIWLIVKVWSRVFKIHELDVGELIDTPLLCKIAIDNRLVMAKQSGR